MDGRAPDGSPDVRRRAFLAAAASGLLAGCSTVAQQFGGEPAEEAPPPVREPAMALPYALSKVRGARVSGGGGNVPSIDDPVFEDAAAADRRLAPGDPVFGVARNGEARAYPQYVMVWHEVCNDVVGGEPVAVTYCPLTATVTSFRRGDASFGVSGALVNSNLVLVDRATESQWPQLLGRAITGPMEGKALHGRRVVWTTWERWRDAHPDTTVLTEDTGYIRDYGGDPYGSYNPRSGYYAGGRALFPNMDHGTGYDPTTIANGAKQLYLGARTPAGPVTVSKQALRERRLVDVAVDGRSVLAVYDPALDTGYVYANPEGRSFDHEGEAVRGPGGRHAPAALPLERYVTLDAFWFAWWGFYPNSAIG